MRGVIRQFVYVRGSREFFLVFDRVDATDSKISKTWFLHIPTEPAIDGAETVLVDGHVARYHGMQAAWVSSPAGVREVLREGRSRAFLKTLLPKGAVLTKRGARSPVVPWRIEVEPRKEEKREYFLYVLAIGDESDETTSHVELMQDGERVGVQLGERQNKKVIWFAREGDLRGWMQIGDDEKTTLNVEK